MADSVSHSHVFLGEAHERNERRTFLVIALCGVVMVAEIAGGLWFGSIGLVADGLHMSTHASALLLAALAYSYARRHADDARFSFGTGKLGDLAGYTSAVVLAMIAVLIGYEALTRLLSPVPIDFARTIPIAVLGLAVNVASVLLLGGSGDNHHHHERGHPHAGDETPDIEFVEHAHGASARDNNMRAAVVHVLADAAVSLLVICGLSLAWYFRLAFMDPVVGLLGAVVIAAWSFSLVRDTGAILLDMTADRAMAERLRATIETDGDRLTDLHLWRLGPGHLAAILAVATRRQRGADYYQSLLRRFRALSHVTVQVQQQRRCRAPLAFSPATVAARVKARANGARPRRHRR